MNEDCHAFGLRLRRQREDRGVTLKAIAESTKIKESLLAGLERGDVSQWPQGIFRRAYVRAYTSAVGLPAQSIVAEFGRLFPDEHDFFEVGELAKDKNEISRDKPRLHQGILEELPIASRLNHARAAVFDLAAVLLMCGLLGGLTGLALWPLVGVIALCYCTVGTVCFGHSLGSWVLWRTDRLVGWMRSDRPSTSQIRERLSIVRGKQQPTQVHREPPDQAEKVARRASA